MRVWAFGGRRSPQRLIELASPRGFEQLNTLPIARHSKRRPHSCSSNSTLLSRVSHSSTHFGQKLGEAGVSLVSPASTMSKQRPSRWFSQRTAASRSIRGQNFKAIYGAVKHWVCTPKGAR